MEGLPPKDLPSNQELVLTLFKSTMSNLDKKPDKLLEYSDLHNKEVANKFIERVPPEELNNPNIFRHYLHHFPVLKDGEGVTTPIRCVFNASLHKKGSKSLNDCLLQGALLTPHLVKILLRLRCFQ